MLTSLSQPSGAGGEGRGKDNTGITGTIRRVARVLVILIMVTGTLRGRGTRTRTRTTNHDNGGQKVGKHRDHTDSTSTIEEESESSTRVSEVVCRGEVC